MSEPYFENLPVNIEDLPEVQGGDFTPINKRYSRVLYLTNTLYFLMALFAVGIFILVQLGPFNWIAYAILLAWILLFLFSLWFASVSTARKSYMVRWHDISYREGVFFQSWITIPFTRVQHCEISKGVVDNIFGLVELRIFTAGGSSSDIVIPGLHPDIAFRLKEQIIGKIEDHDEEE
ncbi:MAG: PH domain-containing protein [Saprospiraceae bacterium]|nr:PH domain-containing protein [Saprospiraceae bacterium]